ncbi:MAG: hypothetical protein II341_03005, partial [Oscillospiraceae bacterium]|nr:hypothetical protein [Oscillospiraceae bacterium]
EMLTQHIKFQEETSGDDEKYLYNKDEKTFPKYHHRSYSVQGYVAQRKYSLEEHFYDNWSELLAYYEISKQQAVESFDWAIRFSVIGILIIVFAIASPCVLILPTEYSLGPVIGSIAGAVVEVFAGPILVVYIKSLSQMSIYHTALADYQRYLSCACLVGNLTEEKRDEMYAEIIREEMKKTTFVEVQSKKTGLFGKKSTN